MSGWSPLRPAWKTPPCFGAVARPFGSAAAEIRALGKGRSVPQMEEGLMDLERGLIRDLLELMPATERSSLELEVGRILAGFSNLDEETVRKTREANLYRLLRKRLGIPRLSLFG